MPTFASETCATNYIIYGKPGEGVGQHQLYQTHFQHPRHHHPRTPIPNSTNHHCLPLSCFCHGFTRLTRVCQSLPESYSAKCQIPLSAGQSGSRSTFFWFCQVPLGSTGSPAIIKIRGMINSYSGEREIGLVEIGLVGCQWGPALRAWGGGHAKYVLPH